MLWLYHTRGFTYNPTPLDWTRGAHPNKHSFGGFVQGLQGAVGHRSLIGCTACGAGATFLEAERKLFAMLFAGRDN